MTIQNFKFAQKMYLKDITDLHFKFSQSVNTLIIYILNLAHREISDDTFL